MIRDIKKKIALLFDWIAEAKAELAKPQAPDLVSLLSAYYTQRRAGAYSQKGKVSNLKEMNETFNYLRANGIYSLEDLEHRVSEHSAATESLKKTLDEQTARMKAIKQLYDSSAAFQSLKPVYDGLQKIKFEKPRAKYKAEHEAELKQFYAARRKLTGEFPDGKVDMKKLTEEYDELAAAMEKVRRASSPQTNGEEVRQLLEYMRQSNYRYRERFLLPYRDGYISVQVKDISHIALDERNTLLCLNNGTSETVPYSLDELESQLNPDVFFRANRQYLIHIDSILSINNWFNSRLKIRLKKYPDVEIIVSRERAAELKGWLDR